MSNWNYCPKCGKPLEQLSISKEIWIKAYRCSSSEACGEYYLEVIDDRHIYPLTITYPNVPDVLRTARKELLDLAWSRVRFIDFKTASIVDLERTLLGTYER